MADYSRYATDELEEVINSWKKRYKRAIKENQKLIADFRQDIENMRCKVSNYITSEFYDSDLNDAIMEESLFNEFDEKWKKILKEGST